LTFQLEVGLGSKGYFLPQTLDFSLQSLRVILTLSMQFFLRLELVLLFLESPLDFADLHVLLLKLSEQFL